MSSPAFNVTFQQAIRVSRPEAQDSHIITLRVRSGVSETAQKRPVFSIWLAGMSEDPALDLPEMEWIADTPLAALDLALGYFALFLRAKEMDGWQVHPTVSELTSVAKDFQLPADAMSDSLAGSVLLGRLGRLKHEG